MNTISRSLAVMSLVLLAMGGGASAATYTWTGGSLADGAWTDTANWSGGSAPPGGVTDDLLFTSNPSNWIAVVASPITVHNMTNNIGMTFSGSSISITGTTPVVAIAPNTTNTYNNDLVIGTGTKFGSTVNAANTSTVVFNGQLSGAMLTYANNIVNSTTPILTIKFASPVTNTINGFMLGDGTAGRGKATIQIAMDDPFGGVPGTPTTLNFNNSGDCTLAALGAPRTINSSISLRGNATFVGTNMTWNGSFTPDTGGGRLFTCNLDAGATLTVAAGSGAFFNASRTTLGGSGLTIIPGEVRDGLNLYFGLTKAGSGTVRLTGTNVYTGQTLVQGGTLEFTSVENKGSTTASALGKPTVDGTKEVIALGSTTTAGTLRYIGTNEGGHSTDRPLNLAGTAGGGTVDASGVGPISFLGGVIATGLGNKTLTLTGTSAATNTIGGTISNSTGFATSLLKDGAGTWVLSGTNLYTGATTVRAGTLLINGTLDAGSAVTVSNGATLGGAGLISGPVSVQNGAHLAPGASPGTLTLANGLSLAGGAVLDCELGTSSDLLRISGGTFAIGVGNTVMVNVADAGGFGLPSYTLIDFSGATPSGVTTGNFSVGSTPTGYQTSDFGFQVTANSVQLTVIPEPMALGLLAVGAVAFWLRRRVFPA